MNKKKSTALIEFAKWLSDIPDGVKINISSSKKAMILVRKDIK